MCGSKHIRKPGGLSPTKEGWERPGAQLVLGGRGSRVSCPLDPLPLADHPWEVHVGYQAPILKQGDL